jgi:hypothetical protein
VRLELGCELGDFSFQIWVVLVVGSVKGDAVMVGNM